MKKTIAVLMIVFLLPFVFSGCGVDKETVQADFSVMVADTTTSEKIRAAAEFMEDNVPRVGEEMATHMLIAYEDYLLRYIAENPDRVSLESLCAYFDTSKAVFDEEKIEKSELKDFYSNIMLGSLVPVCSDKKAVLKIDYTNLLEKYGEYVSESINRLYNLKARITKKPMSENAVLLISWKELLDRTLEAESILKDFSDDEHIRADAMWLYTTYLNTILMGTTNTPIFDYSTKEFSIEAKIAYDQFLLNNPDATITWVLKEYFTYLYGIGYSLDFNDSTMSKVFFDTCDWLVSEAEKRVID